MNQFALYSGRGPAGMAFLIAQPHVEAPRWTPAVATFVTSRRLQRLRYTARRSLAPFAQRSARLQTAAQAQQTDAQQTVRPAQAEQAGSAAKRSPEEAAARQRFEAQAGQDSGDQGLQKTMLNSALALLEQAAATRKVDGLTISHVLRFRQASTNGSAPKRCRVK